MRVSQSTRNGLQRIGRQAEKYSEIPIDAQTLVDLLDDIEDTRLVLLAIADDLRKPTDQTSEETRQEIAAQLERWAVGMAE